MALITVIPGTFTTHGLPTLGLKGFQDTFTRPDADTLGSTEGLPSHPWQVWVQDGTYLHGIRDNEAYAARQSGAGHCVAVANAETADGTLEGTVGTTASSAQFGVAFRGAGVVDCWRFLNAQGAFYRLSKYVGGVNTHIQQVDGVVPADGDRLKVVLDGPSITCYVNDQQVIQHTDTDLQDMTRHGFYNNNDTSSTIRDVKFTP